MAAFTQQLHRGLSGLLDAHFGPSFDAQAKRLILSAALQPVEDWVSGCTVCVNHSMLGSGCACCVCICVGM